MRLRLRVCVDVLGVFLLVVFVFVGVRWFALSICYMTNLTNSQGFRVGEYQDASGYYIGQWINGKRTGKVGVDVLFVFRVVDYCYWC